MKVITVINDEKNLGFNLLRLSCAVNHLSLVTIVSNQYNFYSRRIKDDLLQIYLDSESGDDEIILFTDGNDALLMATETEIMNKFHYFKKDLVFSTETECWPDPSMAHRYPSLKTPYRFLNSGGFIGRVGVIKECLQKNNFNDNNFMESNQYVWANKFLENTSLIGLDTNCEIFCTFSPEAGKDYLPKTDNNYFPYYQFMKQWFSENFLIENQRIFNKITNTWPCHTHFNGNSKYLIDNEIINLIYSRLSPAENIEFLYEAD